MSGCLGKSRILAAALGLATAVALSPQKAIAEPVFAELLHYWRSAGERAALDVVAREFEARGGEWSETVENSSTLVREQARNRVVAGFPPTAIHGTSGHEIQDWAELGIANDLSGIAAEGGWSEVMPPQLIDQISVDGKVVVLPMNIHGLNWGWYNAAIYRELNLDLPHSWEEFFAQAPIIQEAGYVPLAIGRQTWQVRTLFASVLAGVGGNDFYRELFDEQSTEALASETMRRVAETMAELRKWAKSDEPVDHWADATAQVINGKAAVQFIGDWAKGEFFRAGKVLNEDFFCRLAPGTDNSYVVGVDVFALGRTDDPVELEAQSMLANVMLDPQVQLEFAQLKGAIPVRNDVDVSVLDECAQVGLATMSVPENYLDTPHYAIPKFGNHGLINEVGEFFLNDDITVDEFMVMIASS